MRVRCYDCGALAHVSNLDEIGVCADCLAERRELERRVRRGASDAGARHMARERGLLGTNGALTLEEMLQRLVAVR